MGNRRYMHIEEINVQSVLNKHKKRDDWFLDDYSVNPYYGCSFNCIYCYVRGSKYAGHFGKYIGVKINAPEILNKQLKRRAKKNEYGIILISSSTEAYMPIEEEYQITRKLLEIILHYRFPVHIVTKSPLILRDLELLKQINERAILPQDLRQKLKHGVIISFSFSSLNKKITKLFEPSAPSPQERLEALQTCSKMGLLTGMNLIPLLPYLSDTEQEITALILAAKTSRASFVLGGALTLFGNKHDDSKTMYYNILKKQFPHLVPLYKRLYKIFPVPSRSYQEMLEGTIKNIAKAHGLQYKII